MSLAPSCVHKTKMAEARISPGASVYAKRKKRLKEISSVLCTHRNAIESTTASAMLAFCVIQTLGGLAQANASVGGNNTGPVKIFVESSNNDILG